MCTIVLAMCRSHPDLVSFAFSAIPIFYIEFLIYLSPLFLGLSNESGVHYVM